MKSRYPTPEERKLWRESNRFTQRVREPVEDTDSDARKPSPCKGEGWEGVAASTLTSTSKPGPAAATLPLPLPCREGNKPAPLAPLPTRDAAKRFKAHADIEATLDLHGYNKEDAYDAVHRFLTRQQKRGHRHVAIITGKGRVRESVLKKELPHWLNEPRNRALISAFAAAPPEKGGTGVTHVLLKKRPQ